MGDSLHLVDFLVQNMSATALDKPTHLLQDNLGKRSMFKVLSCYNIILFKDFSLNTPLHLCAIYDKPECMKLLLRSGADPLRKNALNQTPLEIVTEKRHEKCEELVCSYFKIVLKNS